MDKTELDTTSNDYEIQIVETPPLSQEYINLREDIWQTKTSEWKEAGKELFNGKLYRYMGIEEDNDFATIKLGLMSYSDRLVRTVLSKDEIVERFGTDYVMKNSCVDVIILTTDGKVAVGVKKNSVDLKQGKLGYIGGNMNADEVVVNSMEDIYTMMMKEIAEESSIIPERERLSFAKLGVSDMWVSFYFIYKLGLSSEEVNKIYKEGEFTEFIAMTPDEIVKTERPAISDMNFSKQWIKEVVSKATENN